MAAAPAGANVSFGGGPPRPDGGSRADLRAHLRADLPRRAPLCPC